MTSEETPISSNLDLENIKIPYVIPNKILMSPGIWNNYYYGPDEIKKAFERTAWDKKEVRSLFHDHVDRSSREWVGEIQNPHLVGDDVIGDLVVIDKPLAQKLAYGAKMGISPKVHGQEENNKMHNFLFDNFSVVINPAVKTAYINNSQLECDLSKIDADAKAFISKNPSPTDDEVHSYAEKLGYNIHRFEEALYRLSGSKTMQVPLPNPTAISNPKPQGEPGHDVAVEPPVKSQWVFPTKMAEHDPSTRPVNYPAESLESVDNKMPAHRDPCGQCAPPLPTQFNPLSQTQKIDAEAAKKVYEELKIPSDIPFEQFLLGINVELEHGSKGGANTNITKDDLILTGKIAWVHLKELKDYYTRLNKMEKSGVKTMEVSTMSMEAKKETSGPESMEPKKEEPDKDDKLAQKPEEEEKKEEVAEKVMAEKDIINQIMQLASMLAQKYPVPAMAKCAEGVKPAAPAPASIAKATMEGDEEGDGTVQGYPPGKATQLPFDGKTEMADDSKYPTGTPFSPPFDGKTAMKQMEQTIQTMGAQIQMLNKKLNEPEMRSVKTAELSQADMESQIRADPDEAFLKVLQGMN